MPNDTHNPGTVERLLERLHEMNIEVSVVDGDLDLNGPADMIDEALGEAMVGVLTNHKAEIVRYLETRHVPPNSGSIPKAPRDSSLPLSSCQERLWFIDQLEGATGAYTIHGAMKLSGDISPAALESAVHQVVARHEALRSAYPNDRGTARQIIHKDMRVDLERADLQAHDMDHVNEWIQRFTERPFDLATGPLLRTALIQCGLHEYVFAIAVHHIVFDGWSSAIFMREVCEIYAAEMRGVAPRLQDAEVHYGDYAAWERAQIDAGEFRADLEYWQDVLRGSPELIELPIDKPRPATQSFRGASVTHVVPQDVAAHIDRSAKNSGVTNFMVWYAVFSTLVSRVSGARDLVIGTPAANRLRPEIEDTIGFFANTVVLRTDLSDNPTFASYLHTVRDVSCGAFDHQGVPFEQLLEAIQPARSLSHNPLFQILFVYQSAAIDTPEVPDATIEVLDLPDTRSMVDLVVAIVPSKQGITLRVTYAADLFEQATVDRWCAALFEIARNLCADPEVRVLEAQILSNADQALLDRWNATERPYPLDRSLHSFIEDQCRRTPERIAVQFGEELLTYAELDRLSAHIAHTLLTGGMKRGDFVGVCLERSLYLLPVLLGVMRGGGVYVPLDPEYPAARLSFMLEDAGAPILIADTAQLGHIQHGHIQGTQAAIYELKHLIRDWQNFRGDLGSISVRGADLAYMIYTSGSTGRPKGAINTHAGIVNRLLWMQDEYRLGEDDRVLQKTPFSFDVSVWELFWPLLAGARLVVAQPGAHRDTRYLIEAIEEAKITTLHFVPSMLQIFLESPGVERLSNVRRVICSGEALPATLEKRFFERSSAELHNLYGPTECAVDVTYWECQREWKGSSVPIGRPIANTSMYILDEFMHRVPIGVTGELYIGGVGVGRGYHNRPELTEERFVSDPFSTVPDARLYRTGDLTRYRTGDLTRYRAGGVIEYLGRTDFQVKLRGFRIEIGEIENVITSFPGVKEAVVVLRGSEINDPRLVAFYVTKKGDRVDAADLRASLANRLPEYMIPSNLQAIDQMPLSANGKVDRKALPANVVAGASSSGIRAIVAPVTPIEDLVAKEWRSVLKIDEVGRNENFFVLGGHSLLATLVTARLSEQLDQRISVRELFEHPVLEDFARAIERSGEGATPLSRIALERDEREEFAF